MMALDLLAQAYEAEDSQTMTYTAKTFIKEDTGDASENEDTVIIQNDTYIERLIKANKHEPRYSELSLSPNAFTPYGGSHKAMIKTHSTSPNFRGLSLPYQPSQDLLLFIENFQKRLDEKTNENEILKKKLKETSKDNETILTVNIDLKHQIKKLEQKENEFCKSEVNLKQQLTEKTEEIHVLNNKISQPNIINEALCDQIEEYQIIKKWLKMQMKMDTNNKLSVKAMEQWKNSIIHNQQQQQYDDEKEAEKKVENETAPLLHQTPDKKDKKNAKKKKYKRTNRDKTKAGKQMDNTAKTCCIPWFIVGS